MQSYQSHICTVDSRNICHNDMGQYEVELRSEKDHSRDFLMPAESPSMYGLKKNNFTVIQLSKDKLNSASVGFHF